MLAVIGFHAFPQWIKGGFVGVDIFFVISGFLISTILIEGLEKQNFRWIDFYARRIRRIFPALLVVLVASGIFGWFSLLADEYQRFGSHIVASAGLNFILWNESGYFDPAAETKPLLHLWSLAIEEQFYIIWPCLLWLSWRLKLPFLTLIIAIGIASFLSNIMLIRFDPAGAFYSPLTRGWELLVGALLTRLRLPATFKCHKIQQTQSFIGMALITGALIWLNK
jgi:peptidoglycan/LPS O-acetylase OafA/YrhL